MTCPGEDLWRRLSLSSYAVHERASQHARQLFVQHLFREGRGLAKDEVVTEKSGPRGHFLGSPAPAPSARLDIPATRILSSCETSFQNAITSYRQPKLEYQPLDASLRAFPCMRPAGCGVIPRARRESSL